MSAIPRVALKMPWNFQSCSDNGVFTLKAFCLKIGVVRRLLISIFSLALAVYLGKTHKNPQFINRSQPVQRTQPPFLDMNLLGCVPTVSLSLSFSLSLSSGASDCKHLMSSIISISSDSTRIHGIPLRRSEDIAANPNPTIELKPYMWPSSDTQISNHHCYSQS